jgi:arginyl-tRNA synthetase
VITGDLDAELARSLPAGLAGAHLPESARLTIAGTWRPAASGAPGSYTTPVALQIGSLTGRSPADLAAAVAGSLRGLPWIESAALAADGYLAVTVTPEALAASAARMATAGLACANSSILRGMAARIRPWPDPAAAGTWPCAWREHAEAMTGQLARAAGAAVTTLNDKERGSCRASATRNGPSPVRDAVAYFGADSVRYRLAGTAPGKAARLTQHAWPATGRADPLYQVQQAHAEAASTPRWAAELHLERDDPGERLASLLSAPAERALLGLLSFLPVRVAAAARRRRPDELPRYLENVAAAWSASKQESPALPFGGRAAPAESATRAARLVLAEAVAAVLASGLALAGITARDRL